MKAEVLAYTMGYKVVDGRVIAPSGTVLKQYMHAGYLWFRFRPWVTLVGRRKKIALKVHRLAAYQKFGSKLHEKGTVVRHGRAGSICNLDDNLDIGTTQQNCMDTPPNVRLANAIGATLVHRKYRDYQVRLAKEFRASGKIYREIAVAMGLTRRQARHLATYDFSTLGMKP